MTEREPGSSRPSLIECNYSNVLIIVGLAQITCGITTETDIEYSTANWQVQRQVIVVELSY